LTHSPTKEMAGLATTSIPSLDHEIVMVRCTIYVALQYDR